MKRGRILTVVALGFGVAGLFSLSAMAQGNRGVSAREALDLVSEKFGAERVEWIIEMRGYEGVPEPEEWEIDVWDPRSRYQAREYWADGREATNEGASDDYFPDRSPFGYVRVTDLKLDSKAAFVIAEAEARKAKMGFDSLNYFLRCREFSREPIWTLDLVDAEGGIAGKVYLSGSTGEVLRTVWIYRGERGRPDGGPLILDSAAPREGGDSATSGARSAPATEAGTSQQGMRKYESPADEPDPLAPRPPVPPSGGDGNDTRIPPPPVPPAP